VLLLLVLVSRSGSIACAAAQGAAAAPPTWPVAEARRSRVRRQRGDGGRKKMMWGPQVSKGEETETAGVVWTIRKYGDLRVDPRASNM